MEKCELCKKSFKSLSSIQKHIKTVHKDMKIENYYDKYISKEKRPKCVFCGEECSFIGFTKGYKKICDNKECISKSRATYTIEYGMKMENLSKEEAKERLENLNKKRTKTFKKTTKEILKENPNFNKEKSHQCEEYWLKRGYNKKEAKKKVKEVLEHLHKKTWEKRKNNPELYKDVNTTQIGYWLKKGYSEKEAKEKIKERQRTFTLDKCVEKYGLEKGTEIYNERHRKWSELMEEKYLNGDYLKYNNKTYSKLEEEIVEILLKESHLTYDEVYCLDNQFLYNFKNNNQLKVKFYDFKIKGSNKIIEINGDYWHCNPQIYNKNYFNKSKLKYAYEIWEEDNEKINLIKNKGYDVLVIWEFDYNENPDEIIKKCVEFLND